ncbi:hypothetical protein [Aquimonas sp.]|uniref:hypothetical protein n=1 Tax=Aquimonas sp. TaxID=1872588 RepID=UPI0037BEFE5D
MVHKLPTNASGRDFVVGSILGERRRLSEALEIIGFDPDTDRLLATGNLLNCAQDCGGVLELLEEPWFFAVRGVREELLLSLLDHDDKPAKADQRGGSVGSEWIARLAPPQRAHLQDTLRRLPIAVTIGRGPQQCVVVHGETPMGLDWTPGSDHNAELYLDSCLHRIAAVHGRRRLMSAQRAARRGVLLAAGLVEVPGCALAVHARDESRRGAVIGNQCYLPSLVAVNRVWTLGRQLIESFSEIEHGRQLALPTA